MKFILQIEVEGDSVEQALSKKNEGTVLSVNPRPQQNVASSQQQSTQRVVPQPPRPNG